MMPSLASVFPFLESIHPKEFQTWHISRAQLLHHYDCAWVLHSVNTGPSRFTLVSFGDEHSDVERLDMNGKTYFLILFPLFWCIYKIRIWRYVGLVRSIHMTFLWRLIVRGRYVENPSLLLVKPRYNKRPALRTSVKMRSSGMFIANQ